MPTDGKRNGGGHTTGLVRGMKASDAVPPAVRTADALMSDMRGLSVREPGEEPRDHTGEEDGVPAGAVGRFLAAAHLWLIGNVAPRCRFD